MGINIDNHGNARTEHGLNDLAHGGVQSTGRIKLQQNRTPLQAVGALNLVLNKAGHYRIDHIGDRQYGDGVRFAAMDS